MSFNMYATPIVSGLSANHPEQQEQQEQQDNWKANNSMSIYVHWVPDELNEEGAYDYFSQIGSISRVEFVLNKNETSRMMFVHFHHWYEDNVSKEIRDNISAHHPVGYPMPIRIITSTKVKEYKLLCRINIRAIPVVEYNTHQLSDMFQRLNERVTEELETVRSENVRLLNEFDAFRLETDKNLTASKIMEQMLSEEIRELKKMVIKLMDHPAYPSSLRDTPEKPILKRTARSMSTDTIMEIQQKLEERFSNAV